MSTAIPTRVIAAPPISIRWVGPQRVTSWPKRRCQTSSSGKPISEKAPQAQIRTPPSGAYQSRPMRIATALGLLLRQHDREEAGGEDAEEAGEDEVVGRVGQRPGVAAVVDVQGDVPVHAEERGEQRDGGDRGGEARPSRAGRRRRSAEAARRCRSCDAAGAVAEAEVEEGGGDDRRRGRGDHDLAEGGAAGGRGGCGERLRRSKSSSPLEMDCQKLVPS